MAPGGQDLRGRGQYLELEGEILGRVGNVRFFEVGFDVLFSVALLYLLLGVDWFWSLAVVGRDSLEHLLHQCFSGS